MLKLQGEIEKYKNYRKETSGVPVVAEQKQIWLGCEFYLWPCSVGQGSGIAMSCSVGCRHGSYPRLQWLWCRQAATALIRPLAWVLPCAARMALKKKKRKEKKIIRRISRWKIHKLKNWKKKLINLKVWFNEINSLCTLYQNFIKARIMHFLSTANKLF